MGVDFLPEHLVVVGGSYVAIEFAQMYRRFGSRVTILQRGPRLVTREDEDVSKAILDLLVAEQIDVRLDVQDIAVRTTGPDILVEVATRSGKIGNDRFASADRHRQDAEYRRPGPGKHVDPARRARLCRRRRFAADQRQPASWALGDCNGHGAFTHTSYNDYEIVAANLLRGESRRVSDRIVTYAVFTDPPLARVGMTEADIRKANKRALVGTRPMTRVGRAYERGETRGFLKVLVDAETKLNPRRVLLRHRSRRSDSLRDRRDVRAETVHDDHPCRTHPSDRVGADPDRIRKSQTAGGRVMLNTTSRRSDLLARLHSARAHTDELFGIVKPEFLFERPIAERHRLAFYIGHLDAFDWNLLSAPLGLSSEYQALDTLFAFGIDPVDGQLPSDQPSDWPPLQAFMDYASKRARGSTPSCIAAISRATKLPESTCCSTSRSNIGKCMPKRCRT
jgi:hypothetical protein